MTTLSIAIFAGLGGMLGWGFADFFAKKTIDQLGDVATLMWGHIFGTGLICLLALYEIIHGFNNHVPLALPQNYLVWLGLLFFGALQATVYLFVYHGFGKGQLALLNPIFASYSGVVALFSIFVFGELVTGPLVAGIITIFVGIFLLNIDPAAFKAGKINFLTVPGFMEVFIAAILAAIWTMSWDRFIAGQNWLTYAAFMYLFMSLSLIVYVVVRKISLKIKDSSLWKYVVLIGLFETGAYLSISWGFSEAGHASVVALLSGAFSLPTIILSRTFLKEKTGRLQTVGSLVIIAGIVLLAVL